MTTPFRGWIYGKPAGRDIVIPDECKDPEQFFGCIAAGKVTASATWTRRADRSVAMTIAASPSPATIMVDISRVER